MNDGIYYFYPEKIRNSLIFFFQFREYKKLHGKKTFLEFSRVIVYLYSSYYDAGKSLSEFAEKIGILEANRIVRSLDNVDESWRYKPLDYL